MRDASPVYSIAGKFIDSYGSKLGMRDLLFLEVDEHGEEKRIFDPNACETDTLKLQGIYNNGETTSIIFKIEHDVFVVQSESFERSGELEYR